MFPDLLRDDVFRLETRRLWLRWPRAADTESIIALAGDRDVAEMTARIPHPYPPSAATEFILSARRENSEGRTLVLMLTPKERPDAAIGCIGLHGVAPGVLELGYWLGKPFWNKGLMTEAARATTSLAWRVGGVDAIQASVNRRNPASRRVLEHCGFDARGEKLAPAPARGGPILVDCYEMNRRASSALDWATPARKCA